MSTKYIVPYTHCSFTQSCIVQDNCKFPTAMPTPCFISPCSVTTQQGYRDTVQMLTSKQIQILSQKVRKCVLNAMDKLN